MALVDACRTRSADTRSVLRVRIRQPMSETAQMLLQQLLMLLPQLSRALGILSIVIVVVVMEEEVRFLRWLLLLHLRLTEECAIEVLASDSRRKPWCLFECAREVAPGFRCDARVFLHLCAGMQNPVRHETLHDAEAQVKHRIVQAHGLGKELHGLQFDAVLQRRDACWPLCSHPE